jgi:hypothetical protein
MLSLRGVLQESASQARRGARGLSVPTGGRELADPWCHVCGRVCEFALKSFVRATVEAIRPSRERGLEPAYICPYKNVQSTLVQIGKTLVQTF